jgi:hypothetical protein
MTAVDVARLALFVALRVECNARPRPAALRQNARAPARPTLPVDPLQQNEIDRCALKCKHYLRFDGRE